MRHILQDVIKHCPFDDIKIISDDEKTVVSAADITKTLILHAELKEVIPEFYGEFGIGNLPLLSGLLDFASYRTDDAKFNIKRKTYNDIEYVELFEFLDDKGYGSNFRCKTANLVDSIEIGKIPWEFSFIPTKSKITEFTKLASLYKDIGTIFTPYTEDDKLILSLGEEATSTHNARMLFAEGIEGSLKSGIKTPSFTTATFLNLLKLAGDNEVMIYISNRGIIGINMETEYAKYMYYIRTVK